MKHVTCAMSLLEYVSLHPWTLLCLQKQWHIVAGKVEVNVRRMALVFPLFRQVCCSASTSDYSCRLHCLQHNITFKDAVRVSVSLGTPVPTCSS